MEQLDEELAKLDLIRERTDANYSRAQEALEKANGDVLAAIITIEEEAETKRKFRVAGDKLIAKVKALIKKGNVTRIQVKKEGTVLFTIPATVGVVGSIIYPPLALLGMAVTLVGHYTVEVEYNHLPQD
ncbi:MAG: DUF4342 domain-containing protein [Bacillota bacterium]